HGRRHGGTIPVRGRYDTRDGRSGRGAPRRDPAIDAGSVDRHRWACPSREERRRRARLGDGARLGGRCRDHLQTLTMIGSRRRGSTARAQGADRRFTPWPLLALVILVLVLPTP